MRKIALALVLVCIGFIVLVDYLSTSNTELKNELDSLKNYNMKVSRLDTMLDLAQRYCDSAYLYKITMEREYGKIKIDSLIEKHKGENNGNINLIK